MNESKYIKFIKKYCKLYAHGHEHISKMLYVINRIVFSNDIPPSVKIGSNFKLPHFGLGVVIHPRAIIGDNVTIYQNVTLGCRNKMGPPIIRNNVLIGAGACILGNVEVKNNARIGANAVVLHDVRENITVVGIPAREVGGEKNEKIDKK